MAIGQFQVLIINYLPVKFETFSLATVEPNFTVVFIPFWSYYGHYGYFMVLKNTFKKVRDIYVPSGSKG